MLMIRRILRALFLGLGIFLMLVSVLCARIARSILPPTPAPRAPNDQHLADALEQIFRTTPDRRFVKAEMVDGPADGHGFPIDADDPPPRVPYRTSEGVYWYVPEHASFDDVILRWDGNAPQPVS